MALSQSPPWMPLSVDDYLADTGHLSTLEHGAYFLLILRYWKDRGLPNDEKMIARYARLTAEQWIESREVLAALFDEGWKHKRIEAELAKADEIIGKRRASAEHMHSKRNAHAEQVQSKSSDTRVPPLPKPEPNKPASSVPESASARVSFVDVWEAFPQNPSSSESKAEAALSRVPEAEWPAVLEAAIRYAKWFGQDCEARKRTIDAGLTYVPHLAKWLDAGAWREAASLPLKGESSGPVIPTVRLDRDRDEALWLACEKVMGKRAPTDMMEWSFRKEVVDQARASMGAVN